MAQAPLTGSIDVDLSAVQPGTWPIELAVLGPSGELLEAESVVVNVLDAPVKPKAVFTSTDCARFDLQRNGPTPQSALCRFEKLDGTTPILIDERSCFCDRPDRPFDACEPLPAANGYDPRNFDLVGNYRLTVQVRDACGVDFEATADVYENCRAWVDIEQPADEGLQSGIDHQTSLRFTLGFEPNGYRSVQCTVSDMGPPETVIRSWQCADLDASGMVEAPYALPGQLIGVHSYRARIDVVDGDGNSVGGEVLYSVSWN